MIFRLQQLFIGFCLISTGLSASDDPRFSTGIIHSGIVEFEVEIEGAKKLQVRADGSKAALEWIEQTLIHSTGRRTPLEKISSTNGFSDLTDLGFVRLQIKALLKNKADATSQIHVFHDAPTTKIPKAIGNLRGNPQHGQNVFARGTCSSCHALEGRGGKVGPDLTKLGKGIEIEKLIESIVAPDAALAKGFETNIVTTKDGTPNLGFIIRDTDKTISIKDSGGQVHEIDKGKVVSRKPQSFSLMPSFNELLSPQQIADLAAFLKAIQR